MIHELPTKLKLETKTGVFRKTQPLKTWNIIGFRKENLNRQPFYSWTMSHLVGLLKLDFLACRGHLYESLSVKNGQGISNLNFLNFIIYFIFVTTMVSRTNSNLKKKHYNRDFLRNISSAWYMDQIESYKLSSGVRGNVLESVSGLRKPYTLEANWIAWKVSLCLTFINNNIAY